MFTAKFSLTNNLHIIVKLLAPADDTYFSVCLGGKNLQSYDPLHRNPLFCGADHTTLWELEKVNSFCYR